MSSPAGLLRFVPGRLAVARRELAAELARSAELGGDVSRALEATADSHPDRLVRFLAAEIASRVRGGIPVSTALEELAPFVGAECVAMARVAERGASAALSWRSLERILDASTAASARVREKWILPVVTISLGVVVLFLMLAGPIPVLLAVRGEGLPGWVAAPASLVATPARGLAAAAIAIALLVGALALVASSEPAAGVLERLPMVGPLRRALRAGVLCRLFEQLVPAGVSSVEAFRIAAILAPPGPERRMLEEAGLRLAAGEPLPEALPESAWLSPLVRALLARPGSRDSLAAGFGRLADFYEGEIERLGRRLAMVTEVVAIGVAGLAAGFLVIAMWKLYFDACGRFLD